jgi:predicted AAA+ superfamily ATPase
MEYHRIIALEPLIKRKSLFLFGPRQTGKTFLLKKRFPAARFYNLLLSDVFFRLSQRPHLLREELISQIDHGQPIIINEILKLPVLLDEVHNLIEEKRLKFILTGSSARKFKGGGRESPCRAGGHMPPISPGERGNSRIPTSENIEFWLSALHI